MKEKDVIEAKGKSTGETVWVYRLKYRPEPTWCDYNNMDKEYPEQDLTFITPVANAPR